MKKISGTNSDGRIPGNIALGMQRREKVRLGLMGVALILIVIAFFAARIQESNHRENEFASVPKTQEFTSDRVARPEIDVAALESLVADEREQDRVLLERPALDALLPIAKNLLPAHFEAMGARELKGELTAEILNDPSLVRGQAFTARGWVDTLRKRNPGVGKPKEYHGRILLEDESAVYFVAADLGESKLTEGSFVRFDGIFLKAFADESQEIAGEWIPGPLLVGPKMLHSWSDLGQVASLPEGSLSQVVDDDLETGIHGIPFEEKWLMLAHARDLESENVDWDAAPVLDTETVNAIMRDGPAYRGKPFRLETSVIMDSRVIAAPENPARLEQITDAWISNWTWTGKATFIRVFFPGGRPEFKGADKATRRTGDKVSGRGFFLKNFAYEPAQGGMSTAPVFIFTQMDKFIAPDSRKTVSSFLKLVVGLVVFLVGFLVIVTIRDKRKSRNFERRLIERRQKQRSRAQPSS